MKQPDKTIAPIFAPTLQCFKKKYNLGLSYVQDLPFGLREVVFLSHRLDPGVKKPYGFHEVDVILSQGNDIINELLDALDVRERLLPLDPTGPTRVFGNGKRRRTVHRIVVGRHPFDPVRDQTYEIRFDYLEADTNVMHERFEAMMLEDGFAWFERYSDPLNISRDVNEPIGSEIGVRSSHALAGTHDRRAEIGIAAACVAEPHRVPDLYENWLEWKRQDDAYALPRGRPRPFEPDMRRRLDTIIDEARLREYSV